MSSVSPNFPSKPTGRVSRFTAAVSQLGVLPSMDLRDAKRVMLANQLAFSYILITAPYFFVFEHIGAGALAWLILPVISLHGLTLWLNAMGRHGAARFNLAAVTSLTIAFYAFALGRGSGLHLLFVPATLNWLILFDWEKERAVLLPGLAIDSALFLGYQSLSFHAGTFYNLPFEVERWLRVAMTVATQAVLIVGILYFLIGNRRTERALAKASQAAMAAERIKGRFIANMSHEIRTPLNVIIGMVGLLEKNRPEEKRRALLDTIRASAGDLLGILNDVLDLSRIEAGKMKVERVPFRVRELSESVLRPFFHEAGKKGLRLVLEMDPGVPDALLGDPLRLRQILNNLLSNALKFTRSGSVALRIRPHAGTADPVLLAFEVEDTGVGIPEKAQERLFRSFGQADDSTTRNFGGSGLGLAICKHLAELMGGSIGLASWEGVGTKVWFAIPFSKAPEADPPSAEEDWAARPAEAEGAAAGRGPGGLRILIVEDHPMNRLVLKEMLHARGHGADEAFDGKQALDACAARGYDLIFMDCHMPVMDGFECAARLKGGSGPRPFIVAVTADAQAETRARCIKAGMDEVILKPLEELELRRILARWGGPLQPSPGAAERMVPAGPESDWVNAPRILKLVEATRLRDPAYRKKALDQYRADVRQLRESLLQACGSGNLEEARDSAHGLKGLCFTMGLDRLGEACKRLEASVRESGGDWSPALAQVEEAFEPSLAELERLAGPC